MTAYRGEREKVFRDHMAGITRQREISKLLAAAKKEQDRFARLQRRKSRPLERERRIAQRKRGKEYAKITRKRHEAKKEKERIEKERERFWPKRCCSVRVTLEAHAFTPMSSRRTSVSSDTAHAFNPSAAEEAETEATLSCDLFLKYVTSCASWEPSYDVQLSTTNSTATLCYDASITNETSETWSNCKVVLSTSPNHLFRPRASHSRAEAVEHQAGTQDRQRYRRKEYPQQPRRALIAGVLAQGPEENRKAREPRQALRC